MTSSLLRFCTAALVLVSNLCRFESVRPVFSPPVNDGLNVEPESLDLGKTGVEDDHHLDASPARKISSQQESLDGADDGAAGEDGMTEFLHGLGANLDHVHEASSEREAEASERADEASLHSAQTENWQKPGAVKEEVAHIAEPEHSGHTAEVPPHGDKAENLHEHNAIKGQAAHTDQPELVPERTDQEEESSYKNRFQDFLDHKPVVEEAVKRWHPTLERLQGEVNRATSQLDVTAETVHALDHQIVGVKKEISKLGHATHHETRTAATKSVRAFHDYDRNGALGADKDGRWVPEAGKWDTFKELIDDGNAKLAKQHSM